MPRDEPRSVSPIPDAKRDESSPRSDLGSGLSIEGRITGEDDLFLEGRFEGEIRLEKNRVTVGRKAAVRGNILARAIYVEGAVEGDLVALEQLVIRPSGRLQGNIASPRVLLEDGAHFRGSIDMEPARTAAATVPSKT